ncbi:MAG: stalk domain-containing protein [Fimbriimonadaceae bacterium]
MKSKLLVCAALIMSAVAAQASFVDASIMIDRAANNKTITVKYDGARAAMVELRINGQSMTSKKVSDQFDAGETTFDIDVAALESGNNKVEIRLFDASGKLLGTQNSDIKIDRSGDGPVFFVSPKPDITTQGIIDIKVGFKSQLKNVYVSFFVNDEFKILKNFPPYTYRWDTMTVPNGWHEVQAWVVDDASASFKTEKLRIFVDNPGGRTKRQDPVVSTKPVDATKPEGTKVSVPMNANVTASGGTKPANGGSGTASGTQAINPTKGQAATVNGEKPANVKITNDPANPGELVAVNTTTNTSTDTTKPNKTPTDTASLKPLSIAPGRRLPDVDHFDIYLGGEKLNFDVSPRITNGIPLSPFRHLLESYGGDVKWAHETKEVNGESDGQTIWFRIGNPEAKVNGQSVFLETAPFIEKGRSIVPLSFMTQALNLNIQYDPNTGHVLIQTASKK